MRLRRAATGRLEGRAAQGGRAQTRRGVWRILLISACFLFFGCTRVGRAPQLMLWAAAASSAAARWGLGETVGRAGRGHRAPRRWRTARLALAHSLVCKAFLVRGSPGTYPVICSPRRPTPRGGRLGGHGPDRTRRASVCAAKKTAASTAPAATRARAGGISDHACHQWSSGGGSSPALWSPSLGLRGSTHPALRRVAASPGRERLPLAATVQRATRRAHQGRRQRPLGSPPPPSAPWPRRGVVAAAAVRQSAARRRRTSRGGAPSRSQCPLVSCDQDSHRFPNEASVRPTSQRSPSSLGFFGRLSEHNEAPNGSRFR